MGMIFTNFVAVPENLDFIHIYNGEIIQGGLTPTYLAQSKQSVRFLKTFLAFSEYSNFTIRTVSLKL